MKKYVFLLKTNENDRDCVKYLDLESGKFECNHYFAGLRISGACFSGFENELRKMDYSNFKTILTKEELQRLFDFEDKIKELRYRITKGDERYIKGVSLRNEIEDIFIKLQSEENRLFFKQIQEEEKEYLKNEFNLNDEDVEYIFNEYALDYRDRAIVGYVFSDIDECAREEAEQFGYITKENERYFNYEAFGQDLLENENYLELKDGRIVLLNY